MGPLRLAKELVPASSTRTEVPSVTTCRVSAPRWAGLMSLVSKASAMLTTLTMLAATGMLNAVPLTERTGLAPFLKLLEVVDKMGLMELQRLDAVTFGCGLNLMRVTRIAEASGASSIRVVLRRRPTEELASASP